MRVLDSIAGLALAAGLAGLACHGEEANVCGNGVLEASNGEACDDAAENADDAACTLECELARCGYGLIQAEVELGDGGDDNPCTPLCAPPTTATRTTRTRAPRPARTPAAAMASSGRASRSVRTGLSEATFRPHTGHRRRRRP